VLSVSKNAKISKNTAIPGLCDSTCDG